jgi:hypothetical protein
VTTTTFTDLGDRTLVEILIRHASKRARDLHLESGMEAGLQDALVLVDELLVPLQ